MPSTVISRIDGLTTSVAVKAPIRIMTSSPITLSGEQTINAVTPDGSAVSATVLDGDRVGVNGQTDQKTNGIYVCRTTAWERAADFDGSLDAVFGTLVVDSIPLIWRLTTPLPVLFGTSNIVFATEDGFNQGNLTDLANATDSLKGTAMVGGAGRVVDSIAALKALLKTGTKRVFVTGYFAVGDGGGGHYYYDSTDTTSLDNGGTIIVATDGARWKRISIGATAATFGALGDGVTDETALLKKARDALGLVELIAGKTYVISSQIAATADGQGFFCAGQATIKMLTGTGKFDRSSYAGTKFDTNSCGLYCLGFDRYTLTGVAITMEASASVRTIMPFALRDSRDSTVDIEAYGFKESEDGVVVLDSVVDSHVVANVHDCGTSDNSLPSMQISAVNIDDERITSIPTTNTYVHGYGKNVVLTGAALTAYGPQTDGINVAGTGDNHGLEILCQFENVGEGFDCFGSYVKATVQAKTCAAYGVKLIHGAQHCDIEAIVDSTGGSAVVFGGSNTASQDVAYNTVKVTASNVGALSSTLSKSGIQFDGNTATFKPRNNYVHAVFESNASMVNAVKIEAGSDNVVEYAASGTQTVLQALIASTAETGNVIRQINRKEGGYVTGRYYGGGSVNLSVTTTLALVANTLYAIPYRVTDVFLATRIGVHIQTAVAGNARLGIYKWENGAPGDLVLDAGTISTGSTGDIEVTINSGNGITLAGGVYALAIVSDVAPTIYASGASVVSVNNIGIGTPGTADNGMSRAFTYGTLPTPFGTVTYAAANLPNLWLRNA